jgi:hypothetical protein
MPPLLAALLIHCDLRIIKAIDLSVEWRQCNVVAADAFSNYWYAGYIGDAYTPLGFLRFIGTYPWPDERISRRY